jgi:hypothetical protein
MPATMLYNEGWMLRLLIDWFSTHPMPGHPLEFYSGAKWYSEPLLASQFAPRTRGDSLGESWTHADGVIGHFEVRVGRGDIKVLPGAQQLVVAEAKMFSGLSSGTKRAEGFDQAARNVACIAHLLSDAKVEPSSVRRLSFYVIAPQEQSDRGTFGDLISKDNILRKVQLRCDKYKGDKSEWFETWFKPTLDAINVRFLSWEELCDDVRKTEPDCGQSLTDFLSTSIAHNRRFSRAAT